MKVGFMGGNYERSVDKSGHTYVCKLLKNVGKPNVMSLTTIKSSKKSWRSEQITIILKDYFRGRFFVPLPTRVMFFGSMYVCMIVCSL